MRKIITILVLLFLSINAQNLSYEKNENLDIIVKNLDSILLANNENDIQDIIEKLENLIKTDGYNPQVASYLGSLTSKLATFSWMPWTKLSYASDGSKIMDKAVKEASNDISIRFNRFFAYIQFPPALNKASFIQQDARFFIKALKASSDKKIVQNISTALSMFFLQQKDNKKYKKYYLMIKDDTLKQRVDLFKKNL